MNAALEDRKNKVLELTKHVFSDESFYKNPKSILCEMPDYKNYVAKRNETRKKSYEITDLSMKPCWQEPLLNKHQELYVAKKFNYYKFMARINALCGKIDRAEKFIKKAKEVQDLFALANMRLAVSVIRKVCTKFKDDLLSEAYISVYKATDCFDWTRGNKFSTYASWAIRKNVWRTNGQLQKEDEHSEYFDVYSKDLGYEEEMRSRDQAFQVKILLSKLPDRESEIIAKKFGIGYEQSFNFKQIGESQSVSRERIRQLHDRAIQKLMSSTY